MHLNNERWCTPGHKGECACRQCISAKANSIELACNCRPQMPVPWGPGTTKQSRSVVQIAKQSMRNSDAWICSRYLWSPAQLIDNAWAFYIPEWWALTIPVRVNAGVGYQRPASLGTLNSGLCTKYYLSDSTLPSASVHHFIHAIPMCHAVPGLC
jgi:hypothetical protein